MNDQRDLDTVKFRRYRRLDGSIERLTYAKRNGRPFIVVPPDNAQLPEQDESPPLWEQPRLYVNLNEVERATWEKILKARPIKNIARDEGVTTQAIYSRIKGNSKGQGGMIGKNFWVLLWWLARQNQNNRKDSL